SSVVLIEQVKVRAENEMLGGRFYCRYRTIEGYRELFERAGFVVRSQTIMAERRNGFFYRFLRLGYRLLPRRAAPLGEVLFDADRRLGVRSALGGTVQPARR